MYALQGMFTSSTMSICSRMVPIGTLNGSMYACAPYPERVSFMYCAQRSSSSVPPALTYAVSLNMRATVFLFILSFLSKHLRVRQTGRRLRYNCNALNRRLQHRRKQKGQPIFGCPFARAPPNAYFAYSTARDSLIMFTFI